MTASELAQDTEKYHILALSLIDGVGNVRSHALIDHFGTATLALEANASELARVPNITRPIIEQILSKSAIKKADTELDFITKNQINIITFRCESYPKRLNILFDKPIILYYRGDVKPNVSKTLGIVGTRKSSEYGGKFLNLLFEELKSVQSLVTVSGMAMGIDERAHRLSIQHHIPTLAIMGLPLNRVYPSQNRQLAHQVLEKGGAWITESNSQESTSQGVFPRRNRLIAALSDALLVVETDKSGGSIITAKLANEYNKDVFALPGRYYESFSRGCNQLIRDHLARLVNLPTDILEDMNWVGKSNIKMPTIIPIQFEGPDTHRLILEYIRKNPNISIEHLTAAFDLSQGQIAEALIALELDGLIRSKPGNTYEIQ